eukprot:CAMPEP_0180737332 /NCGR_PEP_ID=MMETSP1038_2-20121128/24235_1 /TAXON_ID=632150 /ORGANISM="Azadinium spinosum, Strain 3D9" /LENGTH=175 /DNA_ID=CAMNT_0022770429 /DNA_START=210 /DNA_END=737 /DNA_ORIENTATION=+
MSKRFSPTFMPDIASSQPAITSPLPSANLKGFPLKALVPGGPLEESKVFGELKSSSQPVYCTKTLSPVTGKSPAPFLIVLDWSPEGEVVKPRRSARAASGAGSAAAAAAARSRAARLGGLLWLSAPPWKTKTAGAQRAASSKTQVSGRPRHRPRHRVRTAAGIAMAAEGAHLSVN